MGLVQREPLSPLDAISAADGLQAIKRPLSKAGARSLPARTQKPQLFLDWLAMKLEKIHHVAYRCRDAKETVLWYQKMLKMDFVLAIAEDLVPSTKAPDPYMHVFLDAGDGNVLAFFELPTQPEMGRDLNTPAWVQHIAFKVKDRDTLLQFKAHLEHNGVEVLGVTDHGAFHSIYMFDPNGHRVELAYPDPEEAEMLRRLDAVKWDMLEDWSTTKRAPKHAAFLHERELLK